MEFYPFELRQANLFTLLFNLKRALVETSKANLL